jgi:CDP-diacylglycerol---glycerol-3-phosphate 3-phosphatidyltransferase
MSIPNLLTLFRLASAPIFLTLFIGSGQGGFLQSVVTPHTGLVLCLVVLCLSEISDIFDGMLARKLNQVSDFGKLLDPYADSMFRLTCFFSFASQSHGKWIPLWMVMILLYRDLIVTIIRAFGVEQRVFVHARASGKIKAVAQGGACFAILTVAVFAGPEYVSYESTTLKSNVSSLAHYLMWLVTAVTVWSCVDYFWANKHLFNTSKNSDQDKST